MGFYKTFAEFVNNSPSLESNINIRSKNVQYSSINILRYDVFLMKDMDEPSKKEKRKYLSKVWGFSDGRNIYINNVHINNGFFFSKIKSKGEYLYFHSVDKSTRNAIFTSIAGILGYLISKNLKSNKEAPFIFDLKDQKVTPANVNVIGKFLRADLETVNAYKTERRRGKMSTKFKYMEMYNLKNRDAFINEMVK